MCSPPTPEYSPTTHAQCLVEVPPPNFPTSWYDVVVSYIGPCFKYVTDRPTSPSWQERRNAVVWIANNCPPA